MRQLKDWALLHKCAEANASEAELAQQKGDVELARRLYGEVVAGLEMKRWPRPKVVRAEARIDAMLAHPHSWGGAEAYELQLLLAMEFAEGRNVQQDYSVFLAGTRPEVGARPLSAVTSDLEEIASAMRDFRGWLAARKSS